MRKVFTILKLISNNPELVKEMGLHKDMTIWEIRGRFRYCFRKGGISGILKSQNVEIELSDEDVLNISNAIRQGVISGSIKR